MTDRQETALRVEALKTRLNHVVDRFHDIEVTAIIGTTEQLIFKWTPGDDPIECRLERSDTDRAFKGQCRHPKEGRPLELTMVPPKADEKADE